MADESSTAEAIQHFRVQTIKRWMSLYRTTPLNDSDIWAQITLKWPILLREQKKAIFLAATGRKHIDA